MLEWESSRCSVNLECYPIASHIAAAEECAFLSSSRDTLLFPPCAFSFFSLLALLLSLHRYKLQLS